MSGEASTMVVHVAKRGKSMTGLVKYAYGPGKENEHTNQRMVASSPGLTMAYAGSLSQAEAASLGHVMESAWRDQFVEQLALAGASTGGVSATVLAGGGGPDEIPESDKEHVYHLIASLPPGAEWTDDQWSIVAQDLVKGMGFTQGPDDERGARWAAIRHGLSAGGNDHIHIAVNLVRQDGKPVRLPGNDFKLAQDVRKQIERTRDFVLPLHERGQRTGRSMPGYTMAEHQQARDRAKATGQEVPDRVLLQQMVRSAATTSRTESEFMDSLLDARGDVELDAARWAGGGRDEVTGYKVRLGDGPWFSASKLAPDLTLQKLRPAWETHETAESRAHALAMWRGEQDPAPAAEPPAQVEEHLSAATEHLREWNTQLGRLDPQDRAAWRQHAADAAGVVSLLSRTPGPTGERFAIAGNTLARQTLMAVADNEPGRHGPQASGPDTRTPGPRPAESAARQVQIALRGSSPDHHRGWIAVLQQLRQTMDAIRAAQQARGERVAAEQLRTGALDVVTKVQAGLERTGTVEQTPTGDAEVDAARRMHELNTMDRDPMAGLRPTADGTHTRHSTSGEQQDRRNTKRR